MIEVNKTSELNFIGSDSVQQENKVISKHENTVCSNCGSTYISGGWYRTYNKDGDWDGSMYHCNVCHAYFNPNTGRFLKIPEGRKVGGHKNTICSNCGSNSTSGHWYKKRDDSGNWDRRSYICAACYRNPACRLGELDPNSNTYKGMIGVQTIAKVLGDKDCTVMKEGSPFDICSIQSLKYGKIEVKTTTYNPVNKNWIVGNIKPGLFDTLFVLCIGSKFKSVFRVYIISGIEMGNIKTITIVKNSPIYSKYEEFRVSSIMQYQEVFKVVKSESQISKNYVDNGQNFMSVKEKGDICEEIVKIAINAKTSTDIRYDLVHEEYKNVEVKGSDYYPRRKCWIVSYIKSYKFDTLFIICMNNNFSKIDRVYIIPKEDVNVSVISIYENHEENGWYEGFRVKDIRLYQEAHKKVLKNCEYIVY